MKSLRCIAVGIALGCGVTAWAQEGPGRDAPAPKAAAPRADSHHDRMHERMHRNEGKARRNHHHGYDGMGPHAHWYAACHADKANGKTPAPEHRDCHDR